MIILEEEDKKSIVEDLLELLLVNIIYLNVVTEVPNKYVKKLGGSTSEQALEMLVKKVNDLEYLMPLVEDINVENKEVTEYE